MAPKSGREDLVNIDVAPQEKRTALVALLTTSRLRDLVMKVGTHNLTVAISAAKVGHTFLLIRVSFDGPLLGCGMRI